MPNDPYLDASVAWRIKSGTLDLHEAGYHTTIDAMLSAGLATEVIGLISAGKEADVYLASYNGAPIAVKVYRLYRTSHRGGRPIKQDSIGWLAAREYEMTRQAWKGGARVPAPARRMENMFSMRYLGGEDGPAPRLQDIELADPNEFLVRVLAGVETLARAGVVHSDLSAYNILVHQGPWQRLNEASAALDQGMRALQTYFRRYGTDIQIEPFVSRIVRSLDKFSVLE